MRIKKYIKSVRNEKMKVDISIISFIILIILSGLLLTFILLESVFYFSPSYKKVILASIFFSFLSILIWLTISFIFITQNRNKKYSWTYFAKIIGSVIFPDNKDTTLNAFQIESNIKDNQSAQLADSFVDKIAKKIKNVDPNDIIDKKTLLNTKIMQQQHLFFGLNIG